MNPHITTHLGPPRRFVQGGVEWRFGQGTRNPEGDYYVGGEYHEPSIFTVEQLVAESRYSKEDLSYRIDEDLLMDEGL